MLKRFGIHISSIITLILVVSKLNEYIDWSWWLIFLPAILGIAIDVFHIVNGLFLSDNDTDKKNSD